MVLNTILFPPTHHIDFKKWDKYSNFSIVIQLFVFKFCELGELGDDPQNCHFTLLQEKFINTWEPQCFQQLLCQPEAFFSLFWDQHLNTFHLCNVLRSWLKISLINCIWPATTLITDFFKYFVCLEICWSLDNKPKRKKCFSLTFLLEMHFLLLHLSLYLCLFQFPNSFTWSRPIAGVQATT